MPYELRETYLKKALREAMREMTKQSSTIVAAMDERPLNKTKRERPRLKSQIRDKQSSYVSGAVIVSIGGPVKDTVGRHAHLVHDGFHHTSGGTFAGSGGKTRRARHHSRTGKGRRGLVVLGRPYISNVAESSRAAVNAKVIAALQQFANDISTNG